MLIAYLQQELALLRKVTLGRRLFDNLLDMAGDMRFGPTWLHHTYCENSPLDNKCL